MCQLATEENILDYLNMFHDEFCVLNGQYSNNEAIYLLCLFNFSFHR